MCDIGVKLFLRITMEMEKRFNLIRSVGEECIQDEELMRLLAKKSQIICYDGFEPSGRMHIAQVHKYSPIIFIGKFYIFELMETAQLVKY